MVLLVQQDVDLVGNLRESLLAGHLKGIELEVQGVVRVQAVVDHGESFFVRRDGAL